MNFTDMQNQVQILLGDTSTDFFTSQQIQDAINRVLPKVAQESEELLTFCDYTTVSGTQRYALQTDFLKVKQMRMKISASLWEKLWPLDLDQFHEAGYGRDDETGQPIWYKIETGAVATAAASPPGDFWLHPTPDDNGGSNYTIRLYYYQLPTALSAGTDVTEIPEHMHLAVTYQAAVQLAIKNSEFDRANFLEGKYQVEIANAKAHFLRNSRDQAGDVKDAMDYGGGFFD